MGTSTFYWLDRMNAKLPTKLKLIKAAIYLALILISQQRAWADTQPPFLLPSQNELNKLKSAIIYTSEGQLNFRLFPADAPWHVANFKYRADKGLYRNLPFHIYHAGYIIQAGGPAQNPAAPAGYTLPAEFNSHKHVFGSLGMARKADYANPQRRSSGNQFHIILGDAPHMDGAFTVFGELVSADDEVLERLEKGSVIKDIKVFVER